MPPIERPTPIYRRDTNKNKEKNNFDNVLSKLIQDRHGTQH
jgi:hypothetical protein